MSEKNKDQKSEKINFEDLGTVFENNLKIYNQYIENFKNIGSAQVKSPFGTLNNSNGSNFTAYDLSNLVAPTVNTMMETFKNFQLKLIKVQKYILIILINGFRKLQILIFTLPLERRV